MHTMGEGVRFFKTWSKKYNKKGIPYIFWKAQAPSKNNLPETPRIPPGFPATVHLHNQGTIPHPNKPWMELQCQRCLKDVINTSKLTHYMQIMSKKSSPELNNFECVCVCVCVRVCVSVWEWVCICDWVCVSVCVWYTNSNLVIFSLFKI